MLAMLPITKTSRDNVARVSMISVIAFSLSNYCFEMAGDRHLIDDGHLPKRTLDILDIDFLNLAIEFEGRTLMIIQRNR